MGFDPCKIEPELWLKDCGDYYECIAVYADDLLIASEDPKDLVNILTNENNFKLKGPGPISYHLGCGFRGNDDGTLHFAPRKKIEKMIDFHFNIFRSKPALNHVTIREILSSRTRLIRVCRPRWCKKYQSLVGAIQ